MSWNGRSIVCRDARATPVGALGRTPGALRALVLWAALAGLVAAPGCTPDEQAPPDADEVGAGGDADAQGTPDADAALEVELPSSECQTDAQCTTPDQPLPACREARCVAGRCELVQADDGAVCDDGDDCTAQDRCQGGACQGSGAVGCDDANPCTTDGCDPAAGCVHTFNQKPCDDGSACTLEDRCFQGSCGGAALGCDDGNPCTDDACDPISGCVWVPRSGPCEDGNACTSGDSCVEGACQPGPAPDCGEQNPCVDASCDPLSGCSATPLDGPCDDGSACTSGDICVEGVCAGEAVKCDDGNPCTNDSCDPALGCQYVANLLPCDDGDACTLNDVCAGGACLSGAPDPLCCDADRGCDDGDPCTDDACNDGYCAFVAKDCDDGFICTLDVCEGGVCANTPYGPVASGAVLVDSFEGATALGPWTLSSTNSEVRWQLDTSEVRTGAQSLYCGNVPAYSYDFGATEASASRSVQVPAGDASLELWVRQDLDESGNCSFDVTEVYIDGKAQSPCLGSTLDTFTRQTFDLTPWSGSTVTVEIRFDTVDGAINDGMGVWIDDLTVVADSPAGCCLVDEDCPGVGCEAWVCDAEAVICVAQVPEVVCDDQDPCTADVCEPGGTCASTAIPGCGDAAGGTP
ncbi:MAG: hypothetical protein H6746_08945 [Deltaproteobacteria bacterium]|nr:hypothetical protein [Deltaproteobacteria bacterium]